MSFFLLLDLLAVAEPVYDKVLTLPEILKLNMVSNKAYGTHRKPQNGEEVVV